MDLTPQCTLRAVLSVSQGDMKDFALLSRYHYRGGSLGPVRQIFKLVDEHPWRSMAAGIVGVIVYGAPSANLAARNRATGGLFSGMDRSAAMSLLNERMVCIRRVIIDPRYRGLGLASYLVRQTLARTNSSLVEASSVMGRVHPFFERAGMTAYPPQPDAKSQRLVAAFEAAGLTTGVLHRPERIHNAIDALDRPEKAFILTEMNLFLQKYSNLRNTPHSRERTDCIMHKLFESPVYYLWESPPGKPGI